MITSTFAAITVVDNFGLVRHHGASGVLNRPKGLAYILTKIKDKHTRTKEIKDKERPHRQRQVLKRRKRDKTKQKNKEVCILLEA